MDKLTISAFSAALQEAGLLIQAYIPADRQITAITYNSREVAEGTLFACKGAAFKKEYLTDAINRGAAACLSAVAYDIPSEIPFLLVNDVRAAMAVVADLFYGHAWQKLKLIGITGTKGKTTTAYYIKYILDEYLQSVGEKPAAILSSIDVYDGKLREEAHLTTPEAFELHRHFANAVQSGIRYFIMEVSSQALKYDRVRNVQFDTGVFLNISEDHISPIEHIDFEDYFSSKCKLFAQTNTAVVNLSSDYPERILAAARQAKKLVTFGQYQDGDVCGYNIRKEGAATCFTARVSGREEEYLLTMPGLFNVENALAAIAVCGEYGIPTEAVQKGLEKARSAGRMEVFSCGDGSVTAIVDYAHNKLSFERLYQSVEEEYPGRRIVTVFGCPGGKAYNRRTELALLAGKYSERVYLTAEDPATEPAADISREIKGNIGNPDCAVTIIDDRAEAIRTAITEAEPNTVLLITGKGCETYQKIGVAYLPYESDAYWAKCSIAAREETDAIQNV